MRVFVVGGSGLIGTNVLAACDRAGYEARGTYHTEPDGPADLKLDKTDAGDVRTAIDAFQPDVVVDTAAFHVVDDCETERDRAWAVNATGTRNAAAAADAVDAHFVYLSTDYVFPGEPADAPYGEDDPVAPVNYYGRTKYAGEVAAATAERWTVLRPSVVYGLASDNFVSWALGELEAGSEIDVVDDQVANQTYAPDVARACLEAAERDLRGVYHAAGPERYSRYDFTLELADVFDIDPTLVSPVSTDDLGWTAARPTDSSLDSSTLYDAIGREFSAPREAFRELRSRRSTD